MPILEYSGMKIFVDDEGYLSNMNDWTETVACALAEREGVDELTKERMDIIKFMRQYYMQYNAFPLLRGVCMRVHQSKDCYSDTFMEPLKAWKIAGLPKPDEHVIGEIMGEGGVV
ncbi:MAG TPA: TusE/DsrC/DsvC family sulfur relay protein [Thermodesulfovibrionales bacterium]|jgi:tRNA 2-thiouridine synthesizing protein E|nr:TusE/DsrC/DsvC family sulfur relay protein [Thermodesulfovibrionales bacterium]